MCHHGKYDDTLRVEQSGPSDVHVHTRNHSSNRGTCTHLAPPLKLPVSRAEMVMVHLHV